MSRITLHDVALAAGVSDSTVSRALRGLDKVNPKTRIKIEEIARRQHFVLSKNASSLASGKTMRVTILFTDQLNTWFNSSSMQGAYEVLSTQGYDLVPHIAPSAASLDAYLDALLGNRNSDAIIVVSLSLNERQREILGLTTMPVIGFDARGTEGFDATVRIDEDDAMTKALTLLQSLGHRRLGFVSMPNVPKLLFSSQLRGVAFVKVAHDLGYADEHIAHFNPGTRDDFRTLDDAASSVVASILSSPVHPSAICVETDDFAVALIYSLRRFGIRVPQDISVIGFDDYAYAPLAGLTTLHQNPVEMSRMAGRLTLGLMKGEPLPQAHVRMRASLVLRDTTAPYHRR
ncbi:LacI family DNA-binding transcriptional regulator [Bifidobacterium sp.]|uniref:LacI family DNA-binding transcriptional regulator n=1 Tax=Bifidobacterium sp. TaxID=41200 RepID=UPI0039EAAA1B